MEAISYMSVLMKVFERARLTASQQVRPPPVLCRCLESLHWDPAPVDFP
jgi:hypothetical protein